MACIRPVRNGKRHSRILSLLLRAPPNLIFRASIRRRSCAAAHVPLTRRRKPSSTKYCGQLPPKLPDCNLILPNMGSNSDALGQAHPTLTFFLFPRRSRCKAGRNWPRLCQRSDKCSPPSWATFAWSCSTSSHIWSNQTNYGELGQYFWVSRRSWLNVGPTRLNLAAWATRPWAHGAASRGTCAARERHLSGAAPNYPQFFALRATP